MKASFKTGAIALAFLVLGFELALFVHRAAVERVVANRDRPDTVYVVQGAGSRVSGPQADRFAAPPSRAGPLPLQPREAMSPEEEPAAGLLSFRGGCEADEGIPL